ncbi:polar amino acid ABC transporter ATP-binding protein, partial [Bacillus stratosphericus]
MIEIRNIHKSFGNNAVLRGIDLDVAKGSVVV